MKRVLRSNSAASCLSPGLNEEKQQKIYTKLFELPPHVYVSCYDAPENLIRIDTKLVMEYGLQIASLLKHSAPFDYKRHVPIFALNFRSELINVLIAGLATGEIFLPKTLDKEEFAKFADFQGLNVKALTEIQNTTQVAFNENTRMRDLNLLCTRVACAIKDWPRLSHAMANSLVAVQKFNAWPTRAVIRFAAPKTDEMLNSAADKMHELAKTRSTEFLLRLLAVGCAREKLLTAKKIDGKFNEANFNILSGVVENTTDFCTGVDIPSSCAPRRNEGARRFAEQILHLILSHGELHETPTPPSNDTAFARAVASLTASLNRNMPPLYKIFAPAAARNRDYSMWTPELKMLSEVLAEHSIKLSEAAINSTALSFPPTSRTTSGPAFLIEFV